MPRHALVQHVVACAALGTQIRSSDTAEAERSMFVEAMCEEAACDLLCWAMEKGLGPGGAQAEPVHACAHRVLAAAGVRFENV